MTAMNNSQFVDQVLKLAKSAPAFQPTATYDPDGDCIEFLAAPDAFYAERIDDLVTVYYSQQTDEIIGSLIAKILFPAEDVRIVRIQSDPPKVELLIEKS